MMTIDKPTLTYEQWVSKRANPSWTEAHKQTRYAVYKKMNDSALGQQASYLDAFKEGNQANATLNASYGGMLVAAVSASKILRNAIKEAAKSKSLSWSLSGKSFPDAAPLKLGDGTWYGEIKVWREYFKMILPSRHEGGEAYVPGSGVSNRKIRSEWERLVSPLILAYGKEYSKNVGDTYAKVIERAPLFAGGVNKRLADKAGANPALSSAIQNILGIGRGRPAGPGTGMGKGAGADAGSFNYTTIAIVVVIVIILAVGAFFLLGD